MKFISTEEIKLLTGINDPNARIAFNNSVMTKRIADILGISSFEVHTVEKEKVRLTDGTYIRLQSFPVDIETIQIFYDGEEVTGYTFRADPYDFRKFHVVNEAGKDCALPYCEILVNYEAGYVVQSTVEVADNDIGSLTLSIESLGETTEYTFIEEPEAPEVAGDTEIVLGETEAATAANIAEKLGGSVSGAIVTLPLGMVATSSEVVAEEADPKLAIVNANVPEDLKLAVAYMVAGAMDNLTRSKGVTSYSMGTKSVNYSARSPDEGSFINKVFDDFLGKYKRIVIHSK